LINYQVLSPAEYLCDEIDDENADERYNRIHEQCGVIKFTYGDNPQSILITGDSDKEAWKEHITKYHEQHLRSKVLSASHHGSRTFFKADEEDDDIYEDHIKIIQPTYLVISAPKKGKSPHGHPHDDAMAIYKDHIEEEGIFHLGEGPYSVIVDIDSDGKLEIEKDTELIEKYGNDNEDKKENENDDKNRSVYIIPSSTRIDNKPMGCI
jgi:hypothetical protein